MTSALATETDRLHQLLLSRPLSRAVDETSELLKRWYILDRGAMRAGWIGTGDVQNPGASGLSRIRVDWGDGSLPVLTGKRAAHSYRRGRFTLRVSATDKAGNFSVVTRRLVIKKR